MQGRRSAGILGGAGMWLGGRGGASSPPPPTRTVGARGCGQRAHLCVRPRGGVPRASWMGRGDRDVAGGGAGARPDRPPPDCVRRRVLAACAPARRAQGRCSAGILDQRGGRGPGTGTETWRKRGAQGRPPDCMGRGCGLRLHLRGRPWSVRDLEAVRSEGTGAATSSSALRVWDTCLRSRGRRAPARGLSSGCGLSGHGGPRTPGRIVPALGPCGETDAGLDPRTRGHALGPRLTRNR